MLNLCSRILLSTIAVLCCLTPFGCSKSDRPAIARASGVVKINGIPVPFASIRFVPVNGGRGATAMTDEEGVYVLTTYDEEPGGGAAVGDHNVGIMKVAGDGALTPAQEQAIQSNPLSLSEIGSGVEDPSKAPPPKIEYLVPEKYINPDKSGLTATVPPEGSDTLDFDLKK